MGAHPAAPSRLVDGSCGLDELIASDPEGLLGPDVAGSTLPFLVKYLAPKQALSLQVHPNAQQAAAGFAAEEAAGVPRDAAHRRYRDDQPKPEFMLALAPFEALYGFRNVNEIEADFANCSAQGADQLRKAYNAGTHDAGRIQSLVEWVLAEGADALSIADVVAHVAGRSESNRAVVLTDIATQYPTDPGCVVACLMNHVVLQPGEGLFVGAGIVHSYIKGFGLEVMAASDNVLRAGLTAKHVDVPELLRLLDWGPNPVNTTSSVHQPNFSSTGGQYWPTPAPHFQLHVIDCDAGESVFTAVNATIVTCTDGCAQVSRTGTKPITVARGGAAFLPPSTESYVFSGLAAGTKLAVVNAKARTES